MTAYKIFIPDWKPRSTNDLFGHWSYAYKLKKMDKEMVAAYCQVIPKATTKRLLRVKIYLNGKWRAPDPDNITKSLYDALKASRLIVDDSDKWLQAMQPEIIRKAITRGTEIFLMDIEEGKPGYARGITPEITAKAKHERLDA